MKSAALATTLDEMIKETKKGHLRWQLEFQSTDSLADDIKHHVTEDGATWTVDECFVSFCCNFRGKDYLMITYEHVKTHGKQVKTDNLIFLPPLSVRYFDVGILSPYIIDANAVLLDRFHQLWTLLTALYDAKDANVSLKVFDPFE